MHLNEVQEWEKNFYTERGWIDLPPYTRIGFLIEELGEVSRAVRSFEIGRDHPGEKRCTREVIIANLAEELGDVLSNLSILADLYDLTLEDLVDAHRKKLTLRYKNEGSMTK
ncbi:MazG nucleotide pyrophosphohydrolase domain-containing protein [Sporolactobacillus spathodeae]|uniref:NTP pyrophosphatase (Non-canonical NTP hydrolase) n=1 Tax=Sporolactobacillus spathodeae TaxID=1465502 RepID=A0ABS2Q784_9BACL|nr:MazG-like family protein [Sporolactobacillus spathodeae]MBM7657649.1 NTP pyrophosphatase (non-canonical NTP hydrolase) [Sporolactobacillus spathodeae]